MRLGLVRHFPIPHTLHSMVDGHAFEAWCRWYDEAQANPRPVAKAGPEWRRCLSSNLPRARFTAGWLYSGAIEETPLLREVPFSRALPKRAWLPLYLWHAASRVGWWIDQRTQEETRSQTLSRVNAALELVLGGDPSQPVLVVTHGFYMQFLARELRRRGFRGSVPVRPLGGDVHVFES